MLEEQLSHECNIMFYKLSMRGHAQLLPLPFQIDNMAPFSKAHVQDGPNSFFLSLNSYLMAFGPAPDQLYLNGEWISLIASSEDHDTPADQEMMNMTKNLTEQNGFFADFSGDLRLV